MQLRIQPTTKKLLRKAYDGTIIAMSLCRNSVKSCGQRFWYRTSSSVIQIPPIISRSLSALSGEKVTKLGELVPILNRMRTQVRTELTFENARLWGESVLICR